MKKIFAIISSVLFLIPAFSFAGGIWQTGSSVRVDEALVPFCAQGSNTLVFLENNTYAFAGDDEGFIMSCGAFNDAAQEAGSLPNGNAQAIKDVLDTLNPADGWDNEAIPIGLVVLEVSPDYEGTLSLDNYNTIISDPGFVQAGSLSLVNVHGAFSLPFSFVGEIISSLAQGLSDPGILSVLITAIALPLLFWIIAKIADLFPGKKHLIGKGYDFDNKPFNVIRRGRKKYREYWEETKR